MSDSILDLSELQDFTPPEPLANGQYKLRISPGVEIKTREAEGGTRTQLQIPYEVVEGDTQPDGSDPTGREGYLFITVGGFDTYSPKGATFMKTMAKNFLNAVGVEGEIDPEELVGTDFIGINKQRPDEYGDPQENFAKFKSF